jgi:hypothetical protein
MFKINILFFTLETLEESKAEKESIMMEVNDFNMFQILYGKIDR